MEDIKPGIKTTEFYMNLVVVALNVVVLSGIFPEDSPWVKAAVVAGTSLMSLGYGHFRTVAKAGF